MLRLDGYIRVSRVGGREGEGYISPDEQRESIAAYARDLGGEIVAWHDDQDFSGGNTARPAFEAMLARVEAGESDGIVVMKIDRFARSTADGARIVNELVERDQVFASCHERIDPRTPEGRYMLRSFLSNAELFLDQKRSEWVTAKGRAIARGAHIGPTPNGYDRVPKGEPKAGTLVPNALYGPAMTELFRRAAGGKYGDSALAQWMTERAPRASGAPWNSSEIRRWLSNRVYLGEVRYGELVNTNAHKPLTTEKTWRKCQREPGTRRTAAAPFLLSGLIRCAGCRYAMGGANHGGSGGSTPIYRCTRSNRGCPSPSVITAARVETFVIEQVREAQVRFREEAALSVDEEAILEAADLADREVEDFAADLTARQALGETRWRSALLLRTEDAKMKRGEADRVLAGRQTRTLLEADIEDLDRHALRDLLLGTVGHIFIRRRRRGTAEDRTLIVWKADADTIEVPGPHRTGPFEELGW